jgi:hypothetical protein
MIKKQKNNNKRKKTKKKQEEVCAVTCIFLYLFLSFLFLFLTGCRVEDSLDGLSFCLFRVFLFIERSHRRKKLSRTEPHDDSSIYKPISPEGDLNSIHCGPAGLTRHQPGVAW